MDRKKTAIDGLRTLAVAVTSGKVSVEVQAIAAESAASALLDYARETGSPSTAVGAMLLAFARHLRSPPPVQTCPLRDALLALPGVREVLVLQNERTDPVLLRGREVPPRSLMALVDFEADSSIRKAFDPDCPIREAAQSLENFIHTLWDSRVGVPRNLAMAGDAVATIRWGESDISVRWSLLPEGEVGGFEASRREEVSP